MAAVEFSASASALSGMEKEKRVVSDLHEIGTFLIFCAGVVSLFWGAKGIWRAMSIKGSGGTAAGRVISTREGREDSFITVRFSTRQDQIVHFEQLAPPFRRAEYTVFYDAAHPERATVSPRLDIFYGSVLLAFGVFFIFETHAIVVPTLTQ